MTQRPATYPFSGGLDLASAPIATPPGKVISGMNYEVVQEGYRRCDGFERYDGRPAPSDARVWALHFNTGVSTVTPGMTVRGATSGATGIVLADPFDVEGEWNGHASGTLVLGEVAGDFQDGESLYASNVLRARAFGVAMRDSAPDEVTRKLWLALAQDRRRTGIGKVPGDGPVRGVAMYKGEVYAWRDNQAGTAAAMWVSTPNGWAAVPLGRMLRFTAGLAEIIEGDRVHGASSGAVATAARVVRTSGNWGSTAAGYIVLTDMTGSFLNEGLIANSTPSATGTADVPITIAKGGRYMSVVHNFYGSADRQALYFVNGAGKGFEFMDGVLTPIETGMTLDRPTRVFVIGSCLGLIYPGGSIQTARAGEPLIWDVVQGATEIGLGTDVTDVVQSNETAVALFGEQKIGILSGTDSDTFQLATLTEEAGAFPWTAQRVGRTLYLDSRGLRDLAATQNYGNFRTGSLIAEITTLFNAKSKAGVRPVLSFVSRAKSQYRLVWDDGSGLTVFMGRKYAEALEFSLDPVRLRCAVTGELAKGEAIFAGAEDGFVYQLDSGSSFDGRGVKAFIMTPFNHIGDVFLEKRLHKTTIELQCEPETRIGVTAMFDYGDGEQRISGSQDFTVRGTGGHDLIAQGGGGVWDTALWNEFFWSAPLYGQAIADTEGMGVSFSTIIAADSLPAEGAHVLQSYSYHWSPRKLRR